MAENDDPGSVGRNGNNHCPDSERNGIGLRSAKRGAVRALLEDFHPIWFTWCMNAGILGILLHQLPYQFHGLPVISTIAFMIDLVWFTIASICYILHFALFRKQAYTELIDNAETLMLFGAWPIAWLTLVSFISLTITDAQWGGYPWTIVAYVMWWIGAAWMVASFYFVVFTLINRHDEVSDRHLPPLIFIPVVGVVTLATIGGIVSSYSHGMFATLAIPIIIASLFCLGAGLLSSLFLYTFLFHQLLRRGWPKPENTATMFMFVGPMGQSGAALQTLGSAAALSGRFAMENEGTFLTQMAAMPLDVTCILLAILFSGLAVFWLILAFTIMIYRAFRRELMWSVTWNCIIFPTGVLTTSLLMLGIELSSTFFNVITTILVVFMIIVFFVNLGFTIWEISRGKLLIVRENPRVKQE